MALTSSLQLKKDTIFPQKIKNIITQHINGKKVAAFNAKNREKCEKISLKQINKDLKYINGL